MNDESFGFDCCWDVAAPWFLLEATPEAGLRLEVTPTMTFELEEEK